MNAGHVTRTHTRRAHVIGLHDKTAWNLKAMEREGGKKLIRENVRPLVHATVLASLDRKNTRSSAHSIFSQIKEKTKTRAHSFGRAQSAPKINQQTWLYNDWCLVWLAWLQCYTLLCSTRYYVWFVSSAKRAVSDFVYSQPVCCMRHRKNDAKFPVNHNTVVYTHKHILHSLH